MLIFTHVNEIVEPIRLAIMISIHTPVNPKSMLFARKWAMNGIIPTILIIVAIRELMPLLMP